MKKFLAIVFASIIFYSCSAPLHSIYNFDYPLTSQIAFSKTTNISVKIPEGWFTAEDNECKCIDLWLIRNDYKQSLNFTAIHVDEKTVTKIKQNGIQVLAGINKIAIQAKLGKFFKGFFNDEVFELNGKLFSAYEYSDTEGNTYRILVFEHNGRFYELTAISKEPVDNKKLWVIQNTVLTSLN